MFESFNDDYKFLHSDNTVVCQVKQSRVSVDIEEDEDEEEEGSTEITDQLLKVKNPNQKAMSHQKLN